MLLKFFLRDCDVFRDLSKNMVSYTRDISEFSQKLGVKVIMQYKKPTGGKGKDDRGVLAIGCDGPRAARVGSIFLSLIGAATMLGGKQEHEWEPAVEKAFECINSDREDARQVVDCIAEFQIKLADQIRLQKQKMRPVFNMHPEDAE